MNRINTIYKSRRYGFTIVELLIVVVVIAILATITIVSYNGITKTADESALKSDLKTASTKIAIYYATNSDYPASLTGDVATESSGSTFNYTRISSSSFCLSATSKRNANLVYKTDESGVMRPGACASSPVYTAAACFVFNSTTQTITDYYNNEGNNSANPACPRSVAIPPTINGVAVRVLGTASFSMNLLTSVSIPDSVTTIGNYAFDADLLTTLTIPASVTTLGNNAFSSNLLTTLTIPNSVTTIGMSAFSNNTLESITLPSSLTSIPASAFSYNQFSTLTIPSSITSIGSYAFEGNNLSSVSVPTATTVAPYAFDSQVTINRY